MNYYTYAYLTEDGTPYYIGKGKGGRAYGKHGRIPVPENRDRILFLKKNVTEEEAFKHEIYMIAIFGKKCNETGILMNVADGGNAPPKMYGDNSPTKRPEVREKIGAANKKKLLGGRRSEESKRKQSNTLKEKLKNNPRPMSYYEENLKKMAERNRTDKEKHKKHSEFMKNQTYAAKPVEYNNKIYPSMTVAIKETGLSRYFILKNGGKFIKKDQPQL